MDASPPTDNELYRWICLGEAPAAAPWNIPGLIEACRAYWTELKEFSDKRGLLETNFNGKTKDTFHASFWELYLPYVFESAGIPLKRGEEGQPDFYFEKDGQKFWMEAVVCGEPTAEHNQVPPPGNDFFSGVNSSYENRGHAEIETKIRELKWDYGIDGFCQKKFFATEAAFRLVCVTYNLISLLQEKMGQQGHQTLGTLRAQLLACGAVVGHDGHRTVLRLSLAGPWRERFKRALSAFFPPRELNCAAVGIG